MLQAKLAPTMMTLVFALSLFLLNGCLVVKDSPAPGCVEYIGFPGFGGCFGKTAILDLMVEPENACLTFTVNNCNGGVLEVRNGCNETFVLGAAAIAPGDDVNLDVVEEGGTHSLIEVSGNFSEYVPEADQRIEMVGVLGSQEIRLVFMKTRRLCE